MAPTDDSFTLIAAGSNDEDQDGPALVGDPTLGFGGLRTYGTALINHVALKIRSGLAVDNIMLVDSPGMIDSPVVPGNAQAMAYDEAGMAHARSRDRGYDFEKVVRWFAERADIILLFQDPAKPGTTGETLNIMTTALTGLDYKTFIILNKADQFSTVHDFARAYGALCWNLSKVIPRKDLPRIYTMRVPVAKDDTTGAGAPLPRDSSVLKEALADLEATRSEVCATHRASPSPVCARVVVVRFVCVCLRVRVVADHCGGTPRAPAPH
ncbi:hypothetical protein EON67_12390 [archaeon]|nr:MAG: hypothetical protein EON67_12390 [archaeon]